MKTPRAKRPTMQLKASHVKEGEAKKTSISALRTVGNSKLRDQLGKVWTNYDNRPEVKRLLAALKARMPELEKLLADLNNKWGYEEGIYRFYHQSWKVYGLQGWTNTVVRLLKSLMPKRELNDRFMTIVREGTGREFKREDNKRWLQVTRPIVEAFLHARYFLEMAVRFGKKLKSPPNLMKSGWAAFLHLYDLR